jgi:Zn-dependent protease with chaperone function
MNVFHWLFLFPYIWQSLASSLFTLGLVWLLTRLLEIKSAKLRAWIFSLPFLVPMLVPFKGSNGLMHEGLLMFFALKNRIFLWSPDYRMKLLIFVCLLPPFIALIQFILSYIASSRLFRCGRKVTAADEPMLFFLLSPLVQNAGISEPQVYLLPPWQGVQIFVCGTLRPCLALTPALIEALNPSELEAVLAHEVAHLARRDQVFSWMIIILRSLMFFNPILYPLSKWLSQEREKAADSLASKFTGRPKALANALLQVTKLSLEPGCNYYKLLPMVELTSGNALYERVQLLLVNTGKSSNRTLTRIILFGILFVAIEVVFTYGLLLPLVTSTPCVITMF